MQTVAAEALAVQPPSLATRLGLGCAPSLVGMVVAAITCFIAAWIAWTVTGCCTENEVKALGYLIVFLCVFAAAAAVDLMTTSL